MAGHCCRGWVRLVQAAHACTSKCDALLLIPACEVPGPRRQTGSHTHAFSSRADNILHRFAPCFLLRPDRNACSPLHIVTPPSGALWPPYGPLEALQGIPQDARLQHWRYCMLLGGGQPGGTRWSCATRWASGKAQAAPAQRCPDSKRSQLSCKGTLKSGM